MAKKKLAAKAKRPTKPAKKEEAKKMLVSDPDKADRTLQLGAREVKLEAGKEKQELELTASEAKELKDKYPYLKLE